MAACDGNTCCLTHTLPAFQNTAYGVSAEHIDGHADQRQRKDGRAAHGVHIADGVGGGDASKVKRVVHHRHEKVGGGNQGLLVVEQIHSRIV